jgi:rhamnose transport system ATP-binding protein
LPRILFRVFRYFRVFRSFPSPLMLLVAESIKKSFAGVQALKGVSFELRAGEVHALIGENGAGKSTLIKVITGAHQADAGTLEINGRPVVGNSPALAKSLGIAAIYQQPALFPDLSVAENLALGLEGSGVWRRVDWKARRERAKKLLDRIGANFAPETLAGELSMPEQQMVEIARALGASAKVLILDEPTASLTDRETWRLFKTITELRTQGVGMIYISHRLEELFAIADRVTVLRDGETVVTRKMKEMDPSELIRWMVGRELSTVFPKQPPKLGETAFEVRALNSRAAGVRDINFSIRAGEIVGFAGLVGAGRTELARALFGLDRIDSGEILLHGEHVRIDSPRRAVQLGLAYVPEDRRRHGTILEMPIAANTTLAILKRVSKLGFLKFKAERNVAVDFTDRLGVKTPAIFTPAGALSGGNQQKVALARWLATKPSVLILDEPTQGIDVGAKAEIHRLMGDLAQAGMAILLISSELPEILGMSDRIIVMREGAIVRTLDRAEATQQNIIEAALGNPHKSALNSG